jgi:plasmid stabilization system protein ParE
MRRLKIIRSPLSRADVLGIAAYLIIHAGPERARAVVDAIKAEYTALAEMPRMGSPRDYDIPQLRGMRMWVVPRCRQYIIFYRETDRVLEIIRVLGASQNIEDIFRQSYS